METTLTRRGQTVVPSEIRKRYKLQEGDKLVWIDDGQAVKVVFVQTDLVKALKGSGKGYKLTQRLLAERRAEYKHDKIRS